MPYTYNKLRGKIIEVYGSQDKLAEELKVSRQTVSKKMTGKSEFSQEDIIKWSLVLGIRKDEYGEYFFT